MKLRIAVTGSSGFVGRLLKAKLLERNVDLILLQRPEAQRSGLSGPSSDQTDTARESVLSASRITSVSWDPSRGVQELEHLEGLDAVIHLAGRSIGSRRWSLDEKRRLRDSRVLATSRLVEQLCQLNAKPKVFLGASAIGIYGQSGDQWVTEASPASQDFLGKLAADWEQASSPLIDSGVRVAHGRLGIVLGLDGGALAKMLPLFRSGIGGVLGSGKQYWSWISLEDCCRAMLHLLDSQQCSGPFNLVSPDSVSNRKFTKALGQALHRPTILPVPAWTLRLLMGEMADGLLLASCRVRPERLLQSGFSFGDPQLKSFLARIF